MVKIWTLRVLQRKLFVLWEIVSLPANKKCCRKAEGVRGGIWGALLNKEG